MKKNRRRMQNERDSATETRGRRVDGNIRNFTGDGISYRIRNSGIMDEGQFESFYQALSARATQYAIPVASLDEISATKTCEPARLASQFHAEELTRFSQAIFHVVQAAVPRENKELEAALDAHSSSRDGYALLNCLADMSLPYMHDINVGWGPDWGQGNPFDYIKALKTYCQREIRSGRHGFTDIEMAYEFLYQASGRPQFEAVTLTL